VIRILTPLGTRSRLFVLLVGVGMVLLFADRPFAAVAKHGDEVRVAGVCSSGATSKLRLRGGDNGIQLQFEVDHSRPGVLWRVAIVHERRIAWRGAAKTARPDGSFEVRRTLPDLPGSDAVTVSAWGPRGLVCRAAATLQPS
jgi:hypothetical protein